MLFKRPSKASAIFLYREANLKSVMFIFRIFAYYTQFTSGVMLLEKEENHGRGLLKGRKYFWPNSRPTKEPMV